MRSAFVLALWALLSHWRRKPFQLAAVLLGLLETFVARVIDPGLTLAAAYLMFVLILLFRPEGLFGRRRA